MTGGSQGARILSDVVPAAVELLPRGRQTKASSSCSRRAPRTWSGCAKPIGGLASTPRCSRFSPTCRSRMAQAHLVIARAGASTVSELAVIGRPAILVPLPHALDQDQAANARQFAAAGAAIVVAQSVFSPQWLATSLMEAQADSRRSRAAPPSAKAGGHRGRRRKARGSRPGVL